MENDYSLKKQKKLSIKLCAGSLWKQILSSLNDHDAYRYKKKERNLSTLIVDIDLKGKSRKNEHGKRDKKVVKRVQENSSLRRLWIKKIKNVLTTHSNKREGSRLTNAHDQIPNYSKSKREESISAVFKRNKIEASSDAHKSLQSKRHHKKKIKYHSNFRQCRSKRKFDCTESSDSKPNKSDKIIEICNSVCKNFSQESHSVNETGIKNTNLNGDDFIVACVGGGSSQSKILVAHFKERTGFKGVKDNTNVGRNDKVKLVNTIHQDKYKMGGKILKDKEPDRSRICNRKYNDWNIKTPKSADAYLKKRYCNDVSCKACSNINRYDEEDLRSPKFLSARDCKSYEDLCIRESSGKSNKFAFNNDEINSYAKIKRDEVYKHGGNFVENQNGPIFDPKDKILEFKSNQNDNIKLKVKNDKQKFHDMNFCSYACKENFEEKLRNMEYTRDGQKWRKVGRKISKHMFNNENDGSDDQVNIFNEIEEKSCYEMTMKNKNTTQNNKKCVKIISYERNNKYAQCKIPVLAKVKAHNYERKGILQNDNVNYKNEQGKRKSIENHKCYEKVIRKYDDLEIPVTAKLKSCNYERKGILQNDYVNYKNELGKRKDLENYKCSEKGIRKYEDLEIPLTANLKSCNYDRKGISQNDNGNYKNELDKRKDFENYQCSEKVIRKYEELQENYKQKNVQNSIKLSTKDEQLINELEQGGNEIHTYEKHKNTNVNKLQKENAKYLIDLGKDDKNTYYFAIETNTNYECCNDNLIIGNGYLEKSKENEVRQTRSRENLVKNEIKDIKINLRKCEEKLNKIKEDTIKELENSCSENSDLEELDNDDVEKDNAKNICKNLITSRNNKENRIICVNGDSQFKKFKVFVLVDQDQNKIYYKYEGSSDANNDCNRNICDKLRVTESDTNIEAKDAQQENKKLESAKEIPSEKNHIESSNKNWNKNETETAIEKRKIPALNTPKSKKNKTVSICEEVSYLSCETNQEETRIETLYRKLSKDMLRTQFSTLRLSKSNKVDATTRIMGNKKENIQYNKAIESVLEKSKLASINPNGISEVDKNARRRSVLQKYLKYMSQKRKRSSLTIKESDNRGAIFKHDNVNDQAISIQCCSQVSYNGDCISSSVDDSEGRLTPVASSDSTTEEDKVPCSCGCTAPSEMQVQSKTNDSSSSSIEYIRSYSGNLIMCTHGKKRLLLDHIHYKVASACQNKKN